MTISYISESEKKRLLKIMIDHGIYTRAELARRLGGSKAYINHLFNGSYPYYSLRRRIEQFFNTKIFDSYVHSNSDR